MNANLVKEPETYNLDPMVRMMDGAMEAMYRMKTSFYIEETRVNGDCVEVVYQRLGDEQEEWYEGSISIENLRKYVLDNKMNEGLIDRVDHEGQHCQEEIVESFEDMLESAETREWIIKHYLRDGKEVAL